MSGDLRVLVVGGGPAGVTAALQACELGAQVTLVEADRVGGTSLNRGPAPVRTLARAARLVRDWSSWPLFGLRGPAPVPDLAAVLANSERVARYAREKKDMSGHVRQHGIDLVEDAGPVGFTGPRAVAAADGRAWVADRIIIATGGHAARLPVPGAELALTYEDIVSLRSLPARVAVIGGADTGCQLASIFEDFGCAVTLFEAGPDLLPAADPTVSAELRRSFTAQGMTVATGTLVEALSRTATGIQVDYRDGAGPGQAEADAVFFAVGWPASLGGLNLEAAGVRAGRGAIEVDDFLRTSAEGIYAAGDNTGRSMLVQSARMEGRVAARNAVQGEAVRAAYAVVPSGSFTDPEYGRVGLTEPEAARQAVIVTGVARYDDLLRPVADGRTDGFCKLIADRDRRIILGAHVVGEYAAETVQTAAAAMAAGMTVDQVAELQLAFPTFTEGITMAAQKICREIGVGRFPRAWSYLGAEE